MPVGHEHGPHCWNSQPDCVDERADVAEEVLRVMAKAVAWGIASPLVCAHHDGIPYLDSEIEGEEDEEYELHDRCIFVARFFQEGET